MQNRMNLSMQQGMEVTVATLVSRLEAARPFVQDNNLVDEAVAAVKAVDAQGLSDHEKAIGRVAALTKMFRLVAAIVTCGDAAVKVAHLIADAVAQFHW